MFIEAMKTVVDNSKSEGFLEAMSTVAKLTQATGHPVETEALDRVYSELQAEYVRRYK